MTIPPAKPPSPRRKRSPNTPDSGGQGERPLKIGEAARLLGVEAYVLRFWETQFPFLRPRHALSSHRLYQPKDIALLRMVKRLLHVEGYTIAGAKKHISEVGLERLCDELSAAGEAPAIASPTATEPSPPEPRRADLQNTLVAIREDLQFLHKLLTG
jgi:DNA-binding transcriptional MerR regulator